MLFTSLPCAQGTGGENPCIDNQGCLKASDCGRLGRQAAGHPKQQLCIQNGTRAYYLNYLQRGRVKRGKEAQVIRLASQDRKVMDRQVIDRQVEDRQTGRNKADERWYLSRPCSILNSGLRTLRRWLKPICDHAETHVWRRRSPSWHWNRPVTMFWRARSS